MPIRGCGQEHAVAELLENNPEDSAEFKRSVRFEQKTDKSIAEYKRDTKPCYPAGKCE